MQQSPNHRTNNFELHLTQDRVSELSRALRALIAASDATVHVVPDPTHFTPSTTKEILFANQISQEQARQEYSDNVNRNLISQTTEVAADSNPVTAESTEADWQIQAAREQIDKAHQNDFPLPKELLDA